MWTKIKVDERIRKEISPKNVYLSEAFDYCRCIVGEVLSIPDEASDSISKSNMGNDIVNCRVVKSIVTLDSDHIRQWIELEFVGKEHYERYDFWEPKRKK